MYDPAASACPSCGAPRSATDSRFCLRCGAQLPPLDPGLVAQVIPTAMPEQPEPYQQGDAGPYAYAPAPPSRRRARWIVVGIVLVLLACVLAVLVTNAIAIVHNGGSLF